jgi:hypothetical protein
MVRIIWSPNAISDLESMCDFIVEMHGDKSIKYVVLWKWLLVKGFNFEGRGCLR